MVTQLSRYLDERSVVLNPTESFFFMKLGGINLLLRCDYDLKQLPVKVSAFHHQVLLDWKLIYKHNSVPITLHYGIAGM